MLLTSDLEKFFFVNIFLYMYILFMASLQNFNIKNIEVKMCISGTFNGWKHRSLEKNNHNFCYLISNTADRVEESPLCPSPPSKKKKKKN